MNYALGSFAMGDDADDTRRELQRWTDEIANERIHGTTHPRPMNQLTDERDALLPIPSRPFELARDSLERPTVTRRGSPWASDGDSAPARRSRPAAPA